MRTLHHYDEIGLLVPSGRSKAGYRLYGPEDLDRLYDIVLYWELRLPPEEIRNPVEDASQRGATAHPGTVEITAGIAPGDRPTRS